MFVDYKLNFTLANCCLTLLSKGKEMLIVTVAQLLTSIEARPTLLAFKISARAESFVVEAISTDGDLVPLITVDNVLTGNILYTYYYYYNILYTYYYILYTIYIHTIYILLGTYIFIFLSN